MGGHHCCVVDCQCSQTVCRGLTFHLLPRKSDNPVKEAWRQKIIAVINRADGFFNPDTAYICSRHFEEGSFSICGKSSNSVSFPITTWFFSFKGRLL